MKLMQLPGRPSDFYEGLQDHHCSLRGLTSNCTNKNWKQLQPEACHNSGRFEENRKVVGNVETSIGSSTCTQPCYFTHSGNSIATAPSPALPTRVCLLELLACVLQGPAVKSTYAFSVEADSDFSRQHELSSGFY